MKKQMIIYLMLLSVSLTACKPSVHSNLTEYNDPALTASESTSETQICTGSDVVDSTVSTEDSYDPTELVIKKEVSIAYRTESQYVGRFTEEYRLHLEQISGYDVKFLPFEGTMEDALNELRTLLVLGDSTYIPDILVDFPLYGTDFMEPVIMDLTEYFDDPEKSAVFWRVLESCTTEERRTHILGHMYEQEKITIFPANVFTPYPNGVWNLQIRCIIRRLDQRAVWDFLMIALDDAVIGYDA